MNEYIKLHIIGQTLNDCIMFQVTPVNNHALVEHYTDNGFHFVPDAVEKDNNKRDEEAYSVVNVPEYEEAICSFSSCRINHIGEVIKAIDAYNRWYRVIDEMKQLGVDTTNG